MDEMIGIHLINEMTREQLINEFQANQRKELETMELAVLKGHVINIRVEAYRERLQKEAGITMHQNIFGMHIQENEE